MKNTYSAVQVQDIPFVALEIIKGLTVKSLHAEHPLTDWCLQQI